MVEWVRPWRGGCSITVRVSPRAARPGVRAAPEGVVVAVRAPPERGRATAEAAARLAEALGVAGSRVELRTGAAARTKVFRVHGLGPKEARRRLLGPD